MIQVTRNDDSKVWLNVEIIHSLQATPDTVITFVNQDKMIVKDSVETLSHRILEYQRKIHTQREELPFLYKPLPEMPAAYAYRFEHA